MNNLFEKKVCIANILTEEVLRISESEAATIISNDHSKNKERSTWFYTTKGIYKRYEASLRDESIAKPIFITERLKADGTKEKIVINVNLGIHASYRRSKRLSTRHSRGAVRNNKAGIHHYQVETIKDDNGKVVLDALGKEKIKTIKHRNVTAPTQYK